MNNLRILTAVSALALVAACGGGADNASNGTTVGGAMNDTSIEGQTGNDMDNVAMVAGRAVAELRTPDGTGAGSASIEASSNGMGVTVSVTGMPAGTHGAHVHTTGKCEGPKFESAGPHWNPTAKKHGAQNPEGPHAGDIPNLTVGPDGTGTVTFALTGGTLAELLDADGAAFVVHAKADDLKTDPSGNSGDRIACGVFTAA